MGGAGLRWRVRAIVPRLGTFLRRHGRAQLADGEYDFVVTRAVARFAPLYEWTRYKISKNHVHPLRNGILALKGGDLEEEMAELSRKYRTFELHELFEEGFFETKKIIYVSAG